MKLSISNNLPISNKQNGLCLMNRQFLEAKKKTLFNHYLDVCLSIAPDPIIAESHFKVCLGLLEEKEKVENLCHDKTIGFEKILYYEKKFINFVKDGREQLAFLHIDILLCHIVCYCSSADKHYEYFKDKLLDRGTSFKMLFYVIEKKEVEYVEKFPDYYRKLPNKFKKCKEFTEKFSAKFMFAQLTAAMRNNTFEIIDIILKNGSFSSLIPLLPKNLVDSSTLDYVMLQMLKQDFELTILKSSSISYNVMKKFLDSRISFKGHELFEVNCTFMLQKIAKIYKIKCEADVDYTLAFREDITSLKIIVENEIFKSLITHPVIASYIDLKSLKYQRIFFWNFIIYAFLFMFPLSVLICYKILNLTTTMSFLKICPYFIAPVYLLIREVIQFTMVEERNWKKYAKKTTNKFEVSLFLATLILIICCWFFASEKEGWKRCLRFYFAVFILASLVEGLCLIPPSSSQHFSMILKNVLSTFLDILILLAILLVPVSFCFHVIFKTPEIEKVFIIPENKKEEKSFDQNFQSILDSLFKVVLMMTGEYSVDIVQLQDFQFLFVFFFVLMTIWLYALIVGFSVVDIKELKENAREMILVENAKKIITLHRRDVLWHS